LQLPSPIVEGTLHAVLRKSTMAHAAPKAKIKTKYFWASTGRNVKNYCFNSSEPNFQFNK